MTFARGMRLGFGNSLGQRARVWGWICIAVTLGGCDAAPVQSAQLPPEGPIPIADFAALVERVSEEGGYFDTDNLISNETGFLTVMDALRARGRTGGGYIGVGPDQNYSYIAALEPEIVFLSDIRRDNLLHHLLLKALVLSAPTRVEFLSALHGVAPPPDAPSWRDRSVVEVVAYVDGQRPDPAYVGRLTEEVRATIDGFGLELASDDFETIDRFHQTFVRAGLSLRFTSFGRPPRPYYPTNRQLMLAADADGDAASYVSSPEAYAVLRRLHLENRIVPVVGDLSGPSALREMGRVFEEMGVELSAFYTSNVEYYLWRAGTFAAWVDNLSAIPAADDAVVIRSVFPSAGGAHPSAIGNYYSTQTLQRVETLRESSFRSYWDVVTRDVLDLRVGVGAGR